VFIGVSVPDILSVNDIQHMNVDPIVFALANPEPEIAPEVAYPFVKILATGRSDYPNQINNMLCFPGLFRGLLDARAKAVTEEIKLAAAQAIASIIDERDLSEDYIVPSIFDRRVVSAVAAAVADTAIRTGVSGKEKNK
jgi:malate dehydrogenase (oxaloacetate-decarboxylating)